MKLIKGWYFWILVSLLISCQTNKEMKEQESGPKFTWRFEPTAAPGYPMEAYEGMSLRNYGVIMGKFWGESYLGILERESEPLKYLSLIWVSYAEDCTYKIDQKVRKEDYDRMVELFQEGYDKIGGKGQVLHDTYKTIVMGLAPGGVVILWLRGRGRQIEVGRYQAEKFELPQEEINSLSWEFGRLFDKEYREKTMKNDAIIPLKIQEANEGKPIPYGLWDSYRKRYDWEPKVSLLSGAELINQGMSLFNGEEEGDVHTKFIPNPYGKRAIPKAFYIGFRDTKGKGLKCKIYFNEEAIFEAFKTMEEKYPGEPFDVKVEIGYGDTIATARLEHGDYHIRLRDSNSDIFHARLLDKKED